MWTYRLEAPRRLVAHELPVPDRRAVADGQVLLRFLAGGICGSDLPLYRQGGLPGGAEPFGRSLHEIVGEVVASRCDLEVGSRVVGWVEGNCGLSEYVVTTGHQLVPVTGDADDWRVVPIQPLAGVLGAVARFRGIAGASVAVIGLGSIGLLFAHALKAAGAARVTGIDVVDRAGVGAAFGLDEVVHASSTGWSRGLAAGEAPSIVVEAVGHQPATLNDAIRAVAPKGEILYFGLPGEEHYAVDLPRFKDKFLTLYAGTTPLDERRRCLDAAQSYLAEHPKLVDDFVTHVLPVGEAPAAYELACSPLPDRVKVLLAADR